MYNQLGNKTNVIRDMINLVEYIDQFQNSPDMLPYKQMLIKMAGTMLNGLAVSEESVVTVDFPEASDVDVPFNFKPEGTQDSNDCGCDCNESSCGLHPGEQQHFEMAREERILPEFNVQDTIAKIKGELGEK